MSGAASSSVGSTIGKYLLTRRLDGDDASVRYAAEHTSIGRSVIVHCVPEGAAADSAAADQLARQARVLGGATHRNLQGVLDSGRDPAGRPYVVYEALRGVSLQTLLSDHPRGLEPERAARLATQLLEALRALHDAGVVARVLRPDDIMVEAVNDEEELLKIRSVPGAAFLVEGGATPPPVQGYSSWLAPELRRGEPGLDPRVDFYSVGVILRELLTGKRSGDDETLSDTARRALARACAEDPEDRFATADGFLQAVGLMLPTQSRPPREQMPTPDDPLSADLQYLHLRRTTRHGPRDELFGESKLALLPVLLTIEAIYRRLGDSVWEQLCQRVEGANSLLPGAGNTPVHLEHGVPVPLFSEILATVDELAGRADLGLLPVLGEYVAQRGLLKMFPDLPRPRTGPIGPDALVDGFPYIWSRIAMDGVGSVHRLSPTSARLSVREMATPSLELAGLVAGLLREGLKIAGATEVELVLIASQALGDGRDLFGAEWR